MLAGTRPRILQGVATSMSWLPLGADGEPTGTDPGTVTVGVTRSDGTTVVAAGTATGGTGAAARTIALTAAQTSLLDILTATWTISGTVVATTSVETVGGFYFTSADLRSGEPGTADPSRDPLAKILSARAEVETMFESACSVAFVPRFSVDQLVNPCGSLVPLTWAKVRAVRWVRSWSSATATDYTVEQLSYVRTDGRLLSLPTGSYGSLVEVGYEHGYDGPPFDIKREAMVAARAQVNLARAGIPDRATSMQLPEGGSVTLATPGVGRWHFGIPSVDEVLRRYDHSAMIA